VSTDGIRRRGSDCRDCFRTMSGDQGRCPDIPFFDFAPEAATVKFSCRSVDHQTRTREMVRANGVVHDLTPQLPEANEAQARMRLSKFIRAEIEPILQNWEEFAQTLLPARHMDKAALRDHAQHMLLEIADDLDSPQSE